MNGVSSYAQTIRHLGICSNGTCQYSTREPRKQNQKSIEGIYFIAHSLAGYLLFYSITIAIVHTWIGLSDEKHRNIGELNTFPLQLKLAHEGLFEANLAFMTLQGFLITLDRGVAVLLDGGGNVMHLTKGRK